MKQANPHKDRFSLLSLFAMMFQDPTLPTQGWLGNHTGRSKTHKSHVRAIKSAQRRRKHFAEMRKRGV